MATKKIAVMGCGQIGQAICLLLVLNPKLQVEITVFDPKDRPKHLHKRVKYVQYDLLKTPTVVQADVDLIKGFDAVVNAGPHFITKRVVTLASLAKVAYFDLTEDVEDTEFVKACADSNPDVFYAPQCGLAPGAVSIIAAELARGLTDIEKVELRVGALPQHPTNRLKYNLTWSTDGLINEYLNPGKAKKNGQLVTTEPLRDLEELMLNGTVYEAFNTSGGLGSLAESIDAKTINYKTLRYPGHRNAMLLLLQDLQFDRKTLIERLDATVPRTLDDMVIISVAVVGKLDGVLMENRYVHKITNDGFLFLTAIQRTTAGALVAILELFFDGKFPASSNFLKQEDVLYDDFVNTVTGSIYRNH